MTEDTWLVRLRMFNENLWPITKDLGCWDRVRLKRFLLRGLVGKALLLGLHFGTGVRIQPPKAVTRARFREVKCISEGGQERMHAPVTDLTPRSGFELVF